MTEGCTWKFGAALLLGAALALSGCSAADVSSGSCTDSEDCERGQICGGGTCEEAGCEDDGDCAEGEACLFDDGDGLFDPDAEGVCTAVECGPRPLPSCGRGEECIDGVCYEESEDGSCACSDDCGRGEICFSGTCQAPLEGGVCGDDCECPEGDSCVDGTCVAAADPCEGVTCGEGETCVEGVCQAGGCDPACVEGQTCVDGVCQPDSSGGSLCSTCTADADCGGGDNLCVTLNNGGTPFSYCGVACTDDAGCPSGFTCFSAVAGRPNQCRPISGSCDGCLATGCASGQYCSTPDGGTPVCVNQAATCGACTADVECASGSKCVQVGTDGRRFCLEECAGAADCAADEQCLPRGASQVCAPISNSCSDAECTLDPTSCTGETPNFNPDSCECVGCAADTDCNAGEICIPTTGECTAAGEPCTRITDCASPNICNTEIGRCVECITAGDCPSGEICSRGVCSECTCPEGQTCNLVGECVTGGDPGACTSDAECQTLAVELGYTGTVAAACDNRPGGVGCYIPGVCNGNILDALGGGGGLPIPIPGLGDAGTGGTGDPFNAPCPAGTTCSLSADLLGSLLGGGGGGGLPITFACGGCDDSNPDACRPAETCAAPIFDLTGAGPQCGTGGGGGFPLPFP
jgi:hypothetical protein